MKKFYVTTPIYYINDVPHIGHTCTTVVADIIARAHKQVGEEVFFLTGTDEHGQKIAEAAEKEGLDPQTYCNKIAPRFEEAWKELNIEFDFFIRTTDIRHEKAVTEMLQKIFDKGDLYKAKYEGYYCIGCEKFLTESDMVDNCCPLHPREKTVKKSEDNWFFKLSKYVPQLTRLIENDETNYVFPEGKRAEVLAKLKSGVNDISFSRENVKWGITAPWDKSQTIYVWIDALINYYSATRFLEGKADFWPANLHILGKEILWFHTVIWQAMLLSADLPLPVKTYTHSFYMIDGQKMSKSLGNVIGPEQLVDLFGIDGTRYLIARSFPLENDTDVGIDRFVEKYNADLANNLGNLVSRVCKLGQELRIKPFPDPSLDRAGSKNFIHLVDSLKFDEAIGWVFGQYVDKSNNRLNEVAPWKLEATDPKRVEVLAECATNLLCAANYLTSIMPETCGKIIELLTGTIKTLDKPLFPRIQVEATKTGTLAGKILVGKIVEVEKLPDETILKIQVDVGTKIFRIVCGDKNLKIGNLVPIALPGAKVNDANGGKVKIKKCKVHGVESEGMLCSGLELGVNQEHTKIYQLPEEYKDKLGQEYDR